MDSAHEQPLEGTDAQRDETAQAQLEAEIAVLRATLAALKERLRHSFDEPSGFVALGDELRQATERLRLMEAELKTRKLEARQEVWWTSSRRTSGGGAKLARASRFTGRRLH